MKTTIMLGLAIFFAVALIGLNVFFGFANYSSNAKLANILISEHTKKEYLDRVQYTFELYKRAQNPKELSKIYAFYDIITQQRTLTTAIFQQSINRYIPPNLMFAIALEKTGFNPNYISDDGDWMGVFKLNRYVFNKYDKKYLMDLNNNVSLMVQRIAGLYHEIQNWPEVIYQEEANWATSTANKTAQYQGRVLEIEQRLNRGLYTAINAFTENE